MHHRLTRRRKNMAASSPSNVAKQRWKILGQALRTKSTVPASAAPSISVRRFESFALFHVERCDDDENADSTEWYSYTCDELKQTRLRVRNSPDSLKAEDLIGFNNTGNICVWPSEEVLSYYLAKNADTFNGKNVCELGGGMMCLAGLTVGICSSANRVLLTDGNLASIKNVELIVKRNSTAFGDTSVESRILRWGDLSEVRQYEAEFDYIICADCLFFQDMAESLLQTIYFLLKIGGTAIVLAPSRGGTFNNFTLLAESIFQVQRIDRYDAKIQELHEEKLKNDPVYNEDLHFPLMLQLSKLSELKRRLAPLALHGKTNKGIYGILDLHHFISSTNLSGISALSAKTHAMTEYSDKTMGIPISVELDNFKSYSGLIQFEGFRNLSAICAPNGSGKSNFMDAIAFVFGEESLDHLRVDRLSNLINNHPDITRAHVELIFADQDNNGTGINEIRFKRTINKLETSDFLINSEVVDRVFYMEELMRRNINIKAGHFLVYQDTVTSIAMMSEKERTKMFEEICRSGEHKNEYERFEVEMVAAEGDHQYSLQRQKLAITELKSVRSHETLANRQMNLAAKKARKEKELFTFKLYHCERGIERCEKELNLRIGELEQIKARENRRVKRLSDARLEQGKIQRHHQELSKKLSQSEVLIGRNQPHFINAKEQVQHSRTNIAIAEKQLRAAEAAHNVHLKEYKQFETELVDVQQRLKQLNEDTALRGLQLDTEQVREYNRLKKEVGVQSVNEVVARENATIDLKVSEEHLERAMLKMRDHVSILQQKEQDLAAAKLGRDKLAEFINVTEQSVEEQKKKIKDLSEEINTAKLVMDEVEKEIERIGTNLDEVKISFQEKKRTDRLKANIEQLKEILSGVYGRVVDLCTLRAIRDKNAVTEVIGKKMECIVVDNKTTAIDCLNYIKSHKRGNENFIALNYISAQPVKERLRSLDPGKVRLLYDTLEFDPQFRRAVEFITKNILVCDTSAIARHVAYEMDGGGQYDAVSLDGIFFGKNGGIASGGLHDLERMSTRWTDTIVDAQKKKKADLLLKRSSMVKTVRKEVDLNEIRSQYTVLKAKIESARNDINDPQIETLEGNIRDMKGSLEKRQRDLDALQGEVDRLKLAVEAPRQRIRDVEDEVFREFCLRINVANIRLFEEVELKSHQDKIKLRLEFEDQIRRLETQMHFEKSKDTIACVHKLTDEVQKRQREHEDAVRNFEVQEELTANHFMEVDRIKSQIATDMHNLEKIKVSIDEAKKGVMEMHELAAVAQNLCVEAQSDCASKKSQRHSLLEKCKDENILLELLSGDIRKVIEIEDSEDLNESSVSAKIYEEESRAIKIDYRALPDHLKELDSDEDINRQAELMVVDILQLQSELGEIIGVADEGAANKIPELVRKLNEAKDRFARTLERVQAAKRNFEKKKDIRNRLFAELFNEVSSHIDHIYKDLNNDNRAQAMLWPQNPQAPCLGGINYHCMPPGKRLQPMSWMSGGEKTIAALALLFAIRRYFKAPFFVLDEVDASLDRRNIDNIARYLSVQTKESGLRCIFISLKKSFYSHAEAIFGIAREPSPQDALHCISLGLSEYTDVPQARRDQILEVVGDLTV